jgi:FPC/CPF motif-containing protein YcgG
MKRAAKSETAWSYARGRAARATVRRAVVEAYRSIVEQIEHTGDFGLGAQVMAAEIIRRLGLAPIGRDIAALGLRDALEWADRRRIEFEVKRRFGTGK